MPTALRAGFTRVFNVEGGTTACLAEGLPVVHGSKAISLERQVRMTAGSLVLAGALLGLLVHPYWTVLAAAVGAGLLFSGITDTCGMAVILAKMPWNRVKCESTDSEGSATAGASSLRHRVAANNLPAFFAEERMANMKVVIVGGVAGGASAATRARRLSEDAEIVMFERGPDVSFANCGLPYYIGGEIVDRDRLLVVTPEQMHRLIGWMFGRELLSKRSTARTSGSRCRIIDRPEYEESYDN